MVEQQSTPSRSVLFAALALAMSAAAFGAAFYYLDGFSLVSEVIAGLRGSSVAPVTPSASSESTRSLDLPQGMPEEFALQIWQEQVDSQYMIGRLVEGELEQLSLSEVETSSTEASMAVSARMSDGSSVNGTLGFRRFGEHWYVAFASHERGERIMTDEESRATLDEVDVALLNTIIDEQDDSQPVFGEYIDGTVYSINIDEVRPGPNTVTIDATMNEEHGTAQAQIVAIRHEIAGEQHWFLARFTKTGHDPPNL